MPACNCRSDNECDCTVEIRATADANYEFDSDNEHDEVQSEWEDFLHGKILLIHFPLCYYFTPITQQSNVTGVHGDKRGITRSIEKTLNRLIEVTVPRIFKFNQDLFNYVVNQIIVPRINRILAIFAVKLPSFGFGNRNNETVILRQLDEKTIMKYLKENPISYSDDERVLNMLFDERFYAKNFIEGSIEETNSVHHKAESLPRIMSNMSCF